MPSTELPHYFDIVIVASQKPAFFQERRPLMQREGTELRPAVFPLERGTIYEGGNSTISRRPRRHRRSRALRRRSLYGDILRSKKEARGARDDHPGDGGRGPRPRGLPRGALEGSRLEERRESSGSARFYQQRFKEPRKESTMTPNRLMGQQYGPIAAGEAAVERFGVSSNG